MKTPIYNNNLTLRVRKLTITVALINSVAAMPIYADEDKKSLRGSSLLLEEVMVTAQKKSNLEQAQTVPVAITAFSGDQVKGLLATDLREVGFYSPNTQLYETSLNPGAASFSMRGLGVPESTASLDPSVGLIKDGVFYAQRFGSFIETFDLESIEILRGPQGTLFGRNVTGGAVVVKSRRPQLDGGVHGQVGAVAGTNDRLELTGYVDATLIENKLGVILSGASLRSDGTIDNVNAVGGTLGDEDVKNFRTAIQYQADSDFDITFIAEQNRNKGDSAVAVDPSYVSDFFEANRDQDNQIDVKTDTFVLEANIGVSYGVISAVAGYRDSYYGDNGVIDLDGSPDAVFGARSKINHDQSSLEVRYATDGLSDSFDFTVGVFYMEQDLDLIEARYIGPPLAPIQIIQPGAARQDTKSYALFAQGDLLLGESLTLTLGGRYTYEEKDFNLAPRQTAGCDSSSLFGSYSLPSISDCDFVGEVNDNWNDFSPKVTLTWESTENIIAYATAAKGFRSGGYNSRATASGLDMDGKPIPFNEEVLKSYEVGIKSDWFDNRLRINGSFFYNEISDLQRSVTTPPPSLAQTVYNAGEAEIQGIELELRAIVSEDSLIEGDSLAFTGSYGYVDADYTFFDTDGDGVSDSDQLDFSKVSPVTSSASLVYDTPILDIGYITARVGYRYESSAESTVENDRQKLPAVKEWDASITYSDTSDALKVSVFVKNITDNESFFHVLPILRDTIYPRPGRTAGVDVSYSF